MRKKQIETRTSFTLKLSPETDGDLIDLITSIPRGERQGAVRDLLRAGAGIERKDQMSEVLRAISKLEQRIKEIKIVAPAAIPEIVEAVGISEDETERRKAQLKKARW